MRVGRNRGGIIEGERIALGCKSLKARSNLDRSSYERFSL